MVKTPNHQFIRWLSKQYNKLPDDPFFENINPYLKIWLYAGWIHDQEMEAEKSRNQAILIGSFFNPEMAQKMIKSENPDYSSSDLEETSKIVRNDLLSKQKQESDNGIKKRKKRKVIY